MNYYFCDNQGHTKQVLTDQDNPRCEICGGVMTYGRFTKDYTNFLLVKPGIHYTINGQACLVDKGIIASHS